MRLYFFRHGIAEDDDGIMPDALRELTTDGIWRTRRSARMLKLMHLDLDRLFTSPLIRCRQTADIIAASLAIAVQVRDELAPGFNMRAVEGLTQDLGEDGEVMFVGHEPDLSSIVCDLTGARVQVKKGALIRVDLLTYQPLSGELALLLSPKVFNKLG
ncbi:MAG: phosphohistidine phosphatase SixA [Chloroflexota bacterium]|nr:phosphohistidine phosphatase SixA [Chloroflexota bacterium]